MGNFTQTHTLTHEIHIPPTRVRVPTTLAKGMGMLGYGSLYPQVWVWDHGYSCIQTRI